MNSVVNKMDTQVSGILKNTYINWGLRIILVLYAAFANVPEGSMLQSLAENIVFRLAVAVLIVYLSFNDPTLAILLSICFVITIQAVNKNKVSEITKMSEKFYGDSGHEGEDDLEDDHEDEDNHGDDHEGFKGKVKQCDDYDTKEKCNDGNCSWDDSGCHPKKMESTDGTATATPPSTEGFNGCNKEDEEEQEGQEGFSNFQIGAPFTSKDQLNDAQSDKVYGSDESSIQTFKKQHSAQGTGDPPGMSNEQKYALF